jgi:chromosome segregation ATPase
MGINTLEIANRLKAAEREGRAAEEIALVFQEVFEQQLGQLVTKEYLHTELDRLRAEFRAEIAELRSELKGDIAQLRTEMTELRSKLEGDIAQLRTEMAELRSELKSDIAQLRTEMTELRSKLGGDIAELRGKVEGDIAQLRGEVKGDIAELRGEVQLLRADMEKMELRITNALTLRLGALIAGAVAVLGGLNIFF